MHTPAPVRQVEETFHKINRDPMVAPQQKSGDQQRQKGLSTGDHDHARSMAKKQMLARKIFFFFFFFLLELYFSTEYQYDGGSLSFFKPCL